MQTEKGYDQTEEVNCKNAEGINKGCHAENHNRQDPFIMNFWFEHGGHCLWPANDKSREKFGYAVDNSCLPVSRSLIEEMNDMELEFRIPFIPELERSRRTFAVDG